jgi:ribonuclease P protein component
MLARTYRLRRPKDIAKVYQRGRYASTAGFTVKALKTTWPSSRVAFVVSRKVSKSAVTRNTIRRRLSGQLEQVWETVRPGYDIVVSVRADLSAAPTEELLRSLLQQFKRLELITEEPNVSNPAD